MAKPGDLDDIGDAGPGDGAGTAAQDAPETGGARPEPIAQADAHPGDGDGAGKPKPSEARPDGYVTKEERDRIARERDEIRAENRILAERAQKLIDRFFAEREQAAKKSEPEDEIPDESVDPIGALQWTKRELQRLREAQRTGEQQTAQQQEAQRQWQEAYGQVNAYFVQKVAEKPELQTLYDGLRISYAKEYSAFGMSPAQVAAAVDQQEAKIIQWAYANRYPIDAVIEQLAASRGVQAKAPEKKPAGQEQNRDPETGQFIAADPEKAARQRESQERNVSLSSAPGAPVKKMTAKELAQMSEEDMWRYFENVGRKPGSKEFDRDMGFR